MKMLPDSAISISEMEATCWRSLEKIQQLVPLLQEQLPLLLHLQEDLSSCISSQGNHFRSSAFGWIWDHILCCKTCTYRNKSNYKDPFRSFTWEQSVHKIGLSKAKGMSPPSTLTRISKSNDIHYRWGGDLLHRCNPHNLWWSIHSSFNLQKRNIDRSEVAPEAKDQ